MSPQFRFPPRTAGRWNLSFCGNRNRRNLGSDPRNGFRHLQYRNAVGNINGSRPECRHSKARITGLKQQLDVTSFGVTPVAEHVFA